MVRVSRSSTSPVRVEVEECDRRSPSSANGYGLMRQQFHAWAAAVRASVEAIRALAEEAREKEQALEHLLRTPKPDPLAIRRFTLDIKARRLEIERLIAALPTLDETGEADAPGDVLRRAPATGRRVVSSR